MKPLIITAAITGAEIKKIDFANLPVTPQEQAVAAREAVQAGASVIHLHVRDDEGKPSQELAHFERSVKAIRQEIEDRGLQMPVLQFSTGGAVGERMDRRIAPLALKPDMASFNLGTMNFGNDIFVNTRPDMRDLARAFLRYGVTCEYEIYDLGHIDELYALIREGLARPPYHVQFVLGVPGGAMPYLERAPLRYERLQFLLRELPTPSMWGVAGVGRFERPLAELAIEMGGHVRVGLEDNIYLRKGVLAQSNAELVSDIAELARSKGRKIADPNCARALLFGQ